jgi:hypothetical protein
VPIDDDQRRGLGVSRPDQAQHIVRSLPPGEVAVNLGDDVGAVTHEFGELALQLDDT